MKNKEGTIIYVGKAISLKNRVRQYFQSSRNHTPKTAIGTSGQALISGGSGAPAFGTLGLTYGGTNANLSTVATGGIIYKGASALAGTGALTGVLKGNGSSAPSALTSTANYVAYWSDANTISGEQYLSVARGGTGTGSFTTGRVLFGNGTSAINSSANLFWDNTNSRLGVGTSSPAFKLHVVNSTSGNGSFPGGILIENTGATAGEATIAFKNITTATNYWIEGLNQGADLGWSYGGVFEGSYTKMTLLSTGKLGIGTLTPNELLEVAGYIRALSGYKVGTTEVIDSSGNMDYARIKNLPSYTIVEISGTSVAKDANYTFGGTYVTGGNRLKIYRDGIKQNMDTNSTAKDRDYWEVSTTQVRFNYNIPSDSVMEFIISPV
jgi:hypothetical protein